MALRFGKLEDALIAAGAPSDKAAEAAEEVADVVALPHRMERRLVRVEVLVGSTLGGVGLVGAGVLARSSRSASADGAHSNAALLGRSSGGHYRRSVRSRLRGTSRSSNEEPLMSTRPPVPRPLPGTFRRAPARRRIPATGRSTSEIALLLGISRQHLYISNAGAA